MKTIKNLGLSLLMVFFIGQISFAQKGTNEIKELVLTTEHSCDHSKKVIEEALNATSGVSFAEMNQEAKTITVKYDSKKTTPEKIQASAKKSGYDLGIYGQNSKNNGSECDGKKEVKKQKKTKRNYGSC